MAQVAELTEAQFATIDWVLKRYRDAQDRTEGHIEAVANIAPDLDAWLRSLLQIVKSHKVTWVSCEERMPDNDRDVWVHPFEDVDDAGFAPIASWCIDEWWGDDRVLENPGFTYWAEIRRPAPPAGE